MSLLIKIQAILNLLDLNFRKHDYTGVIEKSKNLIKKFPNIVLFSGGVNAKSRSSIFFAAGFDIICTSEAEVTIQKIAKITAYKLFINPTLAFAIFTSVGFLLKKI